MSIKTGTKVVYAHPKNGYAHHQKTARKHLKIGQEYTVENTGVKGWHTNVYLREVPGIAFSSVMFNEKIDGK